MRHELKTIIPDHLQVSIHAPREGCDTKEDIGLNNIEKFQFTHPGRGATKMGHSIQPFPPMFQFTHPGRGATHACVLQGVDDDVSIHAPREGCDIESRVTELERVSFQFTHPGRGATMVLQLVVQRDEVSIHAPREGCDLKCAPYYINKKFQFTHPGRGATSFS